MLIGEVAERSGISARMLRHYDKIGLVSPSARTTGGYRRYTADDVRRLFWVEGLRSLGLSLTEVAAALDGAGISAGEMIHQLIERTRERVAHDQELLRTLGQVQASAPDGWGDLLDTIGLVRGLSAPSPSARQRLALSMAEASHREVDVLTEAALSETDPTVADTLRWAIARAGGSAVPTLAEALSSDDDGRRRRAVAALEKIGTTEALRALAGQLGHPDVVVGDRAAIACGRLGRQAALPRLVAMVAAARDDVEATDVLAALAADHRLADPAVEALAAALAVGAPDARVRLTAALGHIAGTHARARLGALVDDPDRHVALTARHALAHGVAADEVTGERRRARRSSARPAGPSSG